MDGHEILTINEDKKM